MDGWVGGLLMTEPFSRCSLFCAKRDYLIPTKSTAQEGKAKLGLLEIKNWRPGTVGGLLDLGFVCDHGCQKCRVCSQPAHY